MGVRLEEDGYDEALGSLHPPEGVPGFRTNYRDVVQAALRAVLQVSDAGKKLSFAGRGEVGMGGGVAVGVGGVGSGGRRPPVRRRTRHMGGGNNSTTGRPWGGCHVPRGVPNSVGGAHPGSRTSG